MSFFSATGGGSSSSFPILSVSLVGILVFCILLLAYYLFLTRSSWRLDVILTTHHIRFPDPAPSPVAPARGLDHAAIRRIPTFRYPHPHPQEASSECAVCLSEFRDGERLRLLPPCLHAFHIDCIDAWLHATANCPLCRAALFPTCPPHIHIDILQPPHSHPNTALVSPSPSPSPSPLLGETNHQCLEPTRDGVQQPMRRSFSMDSTNDKHLYLSLQKILQRQQHCAAILDDKLTGESSSSRTTGRLCRSFFSFSHGRSSSTAAVILPV